MHERPPAAGGGGCGHRSPRCCSPRCCSPRCRSPRCRLPRCRSPRCLLAAACDHPTAAVCGRPVAAACGHPTATVCGRPSTVSSRSAQNLYSLLPRPRVRGVERPLLCLVADAPHGDRKRPRRNAHLPRRTLQTTGVPCVEASTSTNVPPGEYTSLIIDPSVASLGLSNLRLAISGFGKTPRGLGHSDGQRISVTKICLAKSLDARREPYLGERRWFISRDFNFITSNIKGRSWPPLRMAFAFFVISGEQLSLNVVDDSAKTLSVLGNMGVALDDCRLRFVQKCRRPPQNTPNCGGPISKIKKSRACSPTEIIPNR
jgi:hypothetical protein